MASCTRLGLTRARIEPLLGGPLMPPSWGVSKDGSYEREAPTARLGFPSRHRCASRSACGRCGAAFPRERRPSEVGSKALDLVFDGVGSPLRFALALQRRRAELGENPLPLLAGCRSTAALMAACGAQLWVSFEREERTMAGFVPTGRCLSFAAKGPNENGSC